MTTLKTHVALRVANLDKSIAFYQAMFGVSPVKHKVDYAKFDLENPALNLTLNTAETIQPQGTLSHLGIQVGSTEDVQAAIARFAKAGLNLFEEKNTDCCYALQDKVWVTDPDGNRWEVFVVKVSDTAPEETISLNPSQMSGQPQGVKSCCA
ncbi:VOC family protein [Oscillatoria sp. FACHB-1407]|uniref:ArsI/CadI family heavy metal resistance metalloenzyme n=1 Tax=Oscillatoria sp. FACHB-1407 TaxID=2692847 RepID=UPI0016889F12|nr:ArsI/CadI family heavy metal resistance metalloenzyme [Oscillatoria sp. FACHB-1407]MBD2464578.1 VOC family protein [Oscillatoria sp. FACHB-1407]